MDSWHIRSRVLRSLTVHNLRSNASRMVRRGIEWIGVSRLLLVKEKK